MSKTADKTALDLLLDALEKLATPAAQQAAQELRDLAGKVDPKDPAANWKVMALQVAAELVQTKGVEGVDLAFATIRKAIAKEPVDNIDVLDARTSHLLIAAIERNEQLHRSQVRDFFTRLGVVLGNVGKAFLAGALKGI